MKIVVNKAVLTEALKLSNNVISMIVGTEVRLSSPCLENVLLEASDKQLRIISSNGTISCAYIISENIDIEKSGKVLVKAKMLTNIISRIKQEQIELYAEESSLWIKTKNYLSQINTPDTNIYPDINFAVEG